MTLKLHYSYDLDLRVLKVHALIDSLMLHSDLRCLEY